MAEWRTATLISSEMTAKNVKALRFSIENWEPHHAGQHYDIRLTAEDGYQAERSYSTLSFWLAGRGSN
jgi:ferredoxin-NADP reductase